MRFPRTLFGYIFGRFARAVFGAFLVVLTLIVLIDFVELLRRASDAGQVSTLTLAYMALLHAPSLAEQVMPFAVLFGSMIAFFGLSRSLELVVARASGVSAWQFILPGVVFALLLGVCATTLYSPFSAAMRENFDRLSLQTFGGRQSPLETNRSGAWLRQRSADQQVVLHADSTADYGAKLGAVTVFIFDLQDRFLERVDAAAGELLPGRWELRDATIRRPGGRVEQAETYVVETRLTPEQLHEIFGSAESVSFWDLKPLIAASQAAGLSARGLMLEYQALLAQPLFFAAMVFLAATVSLRIFRYGNLTRMVVTGILAGFVLYLVTHIARELGTSEMVSPATAAWVPGILAMLTSLTILLHTEDG